MMDLYTRRVVLVIDIFISYAEEDRVHAEALSQILELQDWSVWWDRQIPTGAQFDDVIENALDEAKCVIVMWSAHSVKSRWVRTEAGEAANRNVLVPVFIDRVKIPLAFRRIQTSDLTEWDGSGDSPLFKKLTADIKKIIQGGSAGFDDEPHSPLPFPHLPWWTKWKRSIGFLLVFIIGILSFQGYRYFNQMRDEDALQAVEKRLQIKYSEMSESLGSESHRKPGEIFKDCDVCPQLVVVPFGYFRMGSNAAGEADEQPVHVVEIPQMLAVGVYEVRRDEFEAYARETSEELFNSDCLAESETGLAGGDFNWKNPGFVQDKSHPVVCVNWKDANNYVKWLNEKSGISSYRLLTESEWEYFAKSQKKSRYWWGNDIEINRANCNGCGSRWDNKSTAPVGSFNQNIFSISDTAGNVSEWIQDCNNGNYHNAPGEGKAWLEGDCSYRGVRGGRWSSNPRSIRPAARNWYLKGKRINSVGFRVVRSLTNE
jgi:formylglycine-generating enzyme required for sulfatase activity